MSKFHGKGRTKYHIRLGAAESASAHGGQVLVDAFCRRFGLWKKLSQAKGLDPRKRPKFNQTPAFSCLAAVC